jgi:single-strand DNA-binding protein
MASYNRVVLLGRLTRDVEVRAFANGGKVAKFGFAVEAGRKKDKDTGKWESEPCFLDVQVFNRGENGKSADIAEQYLAKGKLVLIEGKLKMDSWTSKDGEKRNKIMVEADSFQMVDKKEGGGEERGPDPFASTPTRQPARSVGEQYRDKSLDDGEVTPNYAPDPTNKDEIPF